MSELVVGSIAGLAANSYVVDVSAGSTLDLTNATSLPSSALPTGSVLQVVSVNKTDTFSSSSSSWVDLTGLSASITPSSTSSKIVILFSVMLSQSADSATQVRLLRDSTPVAVGDSAGTRAQVTVQLTQQGGDTFTQPTYAVSYLDSPSTTSSVTYKAQGQINSTGTFYLNRTASDSDALSRGRGISTITLMEIAG